MNYLAWLCVALMLGCIVKAMLITADLRELRGVWLRKRAQALRLDVLVLGLVSGAVAAVAHFIAIN